MDKTSLNYKSENNKPWADRFRYSNALAAWTHENNNFLHRRCYLSFIHWPDPLEKLMWHADICKLGFITEYLSHAAIVGFMAGVAITVSLQQLRGLFNIKPASFSKTADLVSLMKAVVHHKEEVTYSVVIDTYSAALPERIYPCRGRAGFFFFPQNQNPISTSSFHKVQPIQWQVTPFFVKTWIKLKTKPVVCTR